MKDVLNSVVEHKCLQINEGICVCIFGYKELNKRSKCYRCGKTTKAYLAPHFLNIHCFFCALIMETDYLDTETINDVQEVYCDGGLLAMNKHGGTWAWVGVNRLGDRIIERSGTVLGTETRAVTNNHTEQIAICKALEELPDGWNGKVYSDSKIALGRTFENYSRKNLPNNIHERTQAALKRMGPGISYVHLQGHPTELDLQIGIGAKRNLPVSIHNVRCDELCNLARRGYFGETS